MGTHGGGAGSVMVRVTCLLALVVSMMSIGSVSATLTTNFYDKSCPRIYSIVKAEIQKAVNAEKRMAASLVRLHFHDCFVQGCDASLLLDNAPGIVSEKFSIGNNNSVRGFEVIDTIKAALERSCPRTVSCADILAIASRDSAVEVGLTPSYPVFFGRRDSTTSGGIALANSNLPGPNFNYSQLKDNFEKQDLDETDLIALSGAHTIGRVSCRLVRLFGVNNTNANAEFRAKLAKACPNPSVDSVLQNLDYKTPDKFDNTYFMNLRRGEGIIPSDQTLWSTRGRNQKLVKNFAENPQKFFDQFAVSTIKMGNINVTTDRSKGQIRLNCRVVNPPSLIEQVLVASLRR